MANGRLFATTRSGTIYCFAPKGAKKHGVINEAVDASSFADGTGVSHAALAESIINQSSCHAGYALVTDCTSGRLAYQLAKQTKLNVIAVFADADKCRRACP